MLATGPTLAGDDDKPPAYKIYIDPETGKYTTEDPAAVKSGAAGLAAAPEPAPEGREAGDTGPPYGFLAAAAVIALVAGAVFRYRRQDTI